MIAKLTLTNCLKITLAAIAFFTTFFTIIDFTYFVSVPKTPQVLISSSSLSVKASWALLVDMSLISLFLLQHSLMATSAAKDLFNKYGLQVVYRSLYVILTNTVLHYLVTYWQSVPEISIWELNLNYRPLFWIYVSVHSLSWILIYIGNICTDITELIGVKQVYYNVVNWPDPNLRKSISLQRLNSHMRHPSFLGFILIFWLNPLMSIDRLLLATVFSLYMYIAWNTDENDYTYQKMQYERKYHELEWLHSHRH